MKLSRGNSDTRNRRRDGRGLSPDIDLKANIGYPFAETFLASGYVPPSVHGYFKELQKKGGMGVPSVNETTNRAGDTLSAILARHGQAKLIPKLQSISGVKLGRYEGFIGKLEGLFGGKGNAAAYDYAKKIRETDCVNAFNEKNGPLLHYLSSKYIQMLNKIAADGNKYFFSDIDWADECSDLVQEFLEFSEADPNTLDTEGNHVLDLFDGIDYRFQPKVQEMFDQFILMLAIAGADWKQSARGRAQIESDTRFSEISSDSTDTEKDLYIRDLTNVISTTSTQVSMGLGSTQADDMYRSMQRLQNPVTPPPSRTA